MSASKAILAVDDDPSILKLLEFHLSKLGFKVHPFNDALTAIEALDTTHFDLIITDAIMPNIDGFDFTSRLRLHPHYQATPVLMLTQKSRRDDLKHALEVGITDFIPKPLDATLLVEKVQELLRNIKTDSLEVLLTSRAYKADVSVKASIVKISVSGMTIRSAFNLERAHEFELRSEIFQTIGISRPVLRINAASERKGPTGLSEFEVDFMFEKLSLADTRRLTQWLEREAKKSQ